MKWRCKLCGDEVVSSYLITHKMDYCKCGKTAVDLELGCMRVKGKDNLEILEKGYVSE